MNDRFSYLSNGKVMLTLCIMVIIGVLIQALIFYQIGKKRCRSLNIENSIVKKVTINSLIFSIIPSLPILISYMILVPALGKFLPWVRLSVIGSAAYETMVADMAVKSLGFSDLSAAFSPEAYLTITWMVTGAILLSAFSTFLLKPYDKKLQKMKESGNKFLPIAVGAMFVSLLCAIIAPYLVNYKDYLGIMVLLLSGSSMLLLSKIGKEVKVVKDFAFAASMLIGMVFAGFMSLYL